MKYPLLVLAAHLTSANFARAQDVVSESSVAAPAPTTARIVGLLPDGTRPPPAPPVPKLVFQSRDVLSSRAVNVGQRQMIFQKVAPVALPPVPKIVSTPAPTDPEVQAELESLRESYKSTRLVFVGASFFHFKDAPGQFRTFVRFWPTAGSEPIALWSSANWEYLTGFATYEGADGQPYALLMASSGTGVERMAEINERFGREHGAPPMPVLPDSGPATFVVVEGAADDDSLAAIRALHELYNSDLERLKSALEGRKRAAEERAAFLRANPPEKKNIVLKYWRMDRAGQNGVTPKPADIR